MWKKIVIMMFAMMILAAGNAFFSERLSANGKGTMELVTRNTAASGSKVVFGSFENKDVVMEAIKTINSDILLMGQGGDIRLGLCNMAVCNAKTLSYNNTTLYVVENEINANLSASVRKALNGNVFIPTESDIQDGGTLGLNKDLRKDLSIPFYGPTAGIQPTFYWRGIPMTFTISNRAVLLKKDNYDLTYDGYLEVPVYGAGDGGGSSSSYRKRRYLFNEHRDCDKWIPRAQYIMFM